MNSGRAFVAGVVGAIVMSLIMVLLRAAGVPLHIELRLRGRARNAHLGSSALWPIS